MVTRNVEPGTPEEKPDEVTPPVEDEQPVTEDDPPAETEDNSLGLDDIPTSKSEVQDRFASTVDRARKVGPAPAKQVVGGFIDRAFSAIDSFLDRWENGDKK